MQLFFYFCNQLTKYFCDGNPVFSLYMRPRTFNNFTFCPVSARNFGVSGKKNNVMPINSAGKQQTKINKFHERKKKYSDS